MNLVYAETLDYTFTALVTVIIVGTGIGVAAGIQIFGSGISAASVWLAFWASIIVGAYAALTLGLWLSATTWPEQIIISVLSVVYLIGGLQMVGGG